MAKVSNSGFKNILVSFYNLTCGIKKKEWPSVVGLALFFFLTIAVFWVLKPLKRGLLVSHYQNNPLELFNITLYGAEVEQFGKVLNMFVAFILVLVFVWLYRKLTRQWLITTIASFFALMFVVFAFVVETSPEAPFAIWTFYIFGDMYNTMLVTLFWAFTNDVFTAKRAKSAYGIIGLGGILGGIFGATIVTTLVQNVGRSTLLISSVIPMLLIIGISIYVNRRERSIRETQSPDKQDQSNSVWEGARLVFRSKYLLSIAAIIAIYELVSNIVDFQLSAAIAMSVNSGLETDAYFGMVGMVTNISSIIVQMFITVTVMKRFGVGIALLFLPLAILVGSLGFLIIPGLLFATIMSASDNSLNYSIQQSAKEALYTPTSRDVKYKAKAFIDMFVQRGAKAVSVFLNIGLAITFGIHNVHWLSLLVLALIIIWALLVRYTGRKFNDLEEKENSNENTKSAPEAC
ncbi:MAG: Npt1/Npt2 family nucleotide transporter [Bacteroidales bacterium]|nr:Npt1/Npt2 family nucleotide transporter [Bacteroidales bacterium]